MPFVVEAMVRRSPEEPYFKIVFVDEDDRVDIHMHHLMRQGYQVASVKSRPADEIELREFAYDIHGNTLSIDGVGIAIDNATGENND